MPKRHRITVTSDEELDGALARVRGLYPGLDDAALLRAMALRGAAAVAEEGRRRELIQSLIAWIDSPDWPPMSAEELERSALDVAHKLPAERRERSVDPDG